MRQKTDTTQVSLDGTEATRYVPIELGRLDAAKQVVFMAANLAADGEIDADPEALANLGMDLAEVLDRDDLEGEQVAAFEQKEDA